MYCGHHRLRRGWRPAHVQHPSPRARNWRARGGHDCEASMAAILADVELIAIYVTRKIHRATRERALTDLLRDPHLRIARKRRRFFYPRQAGCRGEHRHQIRLGPRPSRTRRMSWPRLANLCTTTYSRVRCAVYGIRCTIVSERRPTCHALRIHVVIVSRTAYLYPPQLPAEVGY